MYTSHHLNLIQTITLNWQSLKFYCFINTLNYANKYFFEIFCIINRNEMMWMNQINIIYQNLKNDERNIDLTNTNEISMWIQKEQNKFLSLFAKIMINKFHDFSFVWRFQKSRFHWWSRKQMSIYFNIIKITEYKFLNCNKEIITTITIKT